ncbi:MAG: hypothetical protein ABGZ35_03810, partial [Planctomycetaceae bacterium]
VFGQRGERQEDDRQWLAYQYVHGEMAADDTESFEQKMLEDGDLCEAVAEISLLLTAIASSADAAGMAPLRPHHVPSGSVVSRVAATLAALCCCVGLVVILSTSSMLQPARTGNMTEISEATMLVTAWVDTGLTTEDREEHETDVTDEGKLVVPEWMLAGVSGIVIDETEPADMPDESDESQGLL